VSRASEAYDRLHTALVTNIPDCQDIDLFTADGLSKADMGVLKQICESCPLRAPCDDYGRIAKPPAGVWFGKSYRASGAKKSSND
jgi:hypothetical protein